MKPMSTNLRVHPEQLAVLYARARRARAVALGNAFARLFHKLASGFDVRPGRMHWG